MHDNLVSLDEQLGKQESAGQKVSSPRQFNHKSAVQTMQSQRLNLATSLATGLKANREAGFKDAGAEKEEARLRALLDQ